jgi:hypothetical protein
LAGLAKRRAYEANLFVSKGIDIGKAILTALGLLSSVN